MKVRLSIGIGFFILCNSVSSSGADMGALSQEKTAKGSHSQARKANSKELQKRPDDLVFFINHARSTPPEFAADLLIRLAQSRRITDPLWKRELLMEAFRSAADAQEPVKQKYASWQAVDTRAGYRALAYELGLDRLSLQCRAVKMLAQFDPPTARGLFSEIDFQLNPIGCEESLIYEVSEFYSLLSQLAQTAFHKTEVQRGEPLHFIEPYIAKMTSAVQMKPVSDTILSLKVSPAELERLVFVFSQTLPKIQSDDRAFWFSDRTTTEGMFRLVRALQ